MNDRGQIREIPEGITPYPDEIMLTPEEAELYNAKPIDERKRIYRRLVKTRQTFGQQLAEATRRMEEAKRDA